ncbi:MAG: glycosyltransferase family 2 protein, partial [Anaerolineae bacterium]
MNRVAEWLGLGGGRSRFWAHDRVLDVDTFRGACMLCRMEAVRQVGLMHTVSLAGGEETEWHYRFRKLGWRVTFYPKAEVVHLGQQTTGKVSSLRNERLKSLLYFFRQHGSKREFRIFCGLVWFALGWRWLWHSLRGRPEDAKIELEGMRIICRWMGSQCGSPDG